MTVPANLTYSGIETRVANQLRIPTANTTEMTKIQAVINEVYRDLWVKQDWWWALKRAVINTVARIVAGTVSLTNGSTAITFSSAPASSVAGFVIRFTGDANDSNAVYRISTHTAGATAATLDAAATATTNTTASYILNQDSYALASDVGKLINVKRYGRALPLDRWGIERMSAVKLYDATEGKPEAYSVFDYSTTGDPTTTRLLQVYPYPDKTYRLEMFYKQQLNTEISGTTQPFVPDEYRQILVYGALSRAYPVFLNDLDRGKYYLQLFNDLLALMSAQQKEYAGDHSGVAPRDVYRQTSRRRSGGTTLGGLFDTLPNRP